MAKKRRNARDKSRRCINCNKYDKCTQQDCHTDEKTGILTCDKFVLKI